MTEGEKKIAESGAGFVQATAAMIREWSRLVGVIDGETAEDDAMLHNIRCSMLRTADRLESGVRSLREA